MTPQEAIQVVILEDEEHAREGLKALIQSADIVVAGAFASAAACIAHVRSHPTDIAVVDLRLHYMGDFSEGMDAIEEILAVSPQTRVIVASVSASPRRLLDCIQAGASGYVHKVAPREHRPTWSQIIRLVQAGGRFYDMEMVRHLLNYVDVHRLPIAEGDRYDDWERNPNPLTERQAEVLRLAERGLSNRQIADQLVVSERTVKNHMYQIMAKLDARTRQEAAMRAHSLGYLG